MAVLPADVAVREYFAQFEAVMHAYYVADKSVGSLPRSGDQANPCTLRRLQPDQRSTTQSAAQSLAEAQSEQCLPCHKTMAPPFRFTPCTNAERQSVSEAVSVTLIWIEVNVH